MIFIREKKRDDIIERFIISKSVPYFYIRMISIKDMIKKKDLKIHMKKDL